MQNLNSISASILSKRRSDLDTENFPLSKLTLSTYDIRKNRVRNPKLREDLKRDNQLQPITINIKTDGKKLTNLLNALLFIVVNGRTRKIEMDDLFATDGLFANVSVVVYENLTELEENYLNAQINISQNPLTPDEKREFIIKYKNEIPIEEMAKALGLGMEMFKNYLATTKVDKEVLKAWTPKSEGHGRGTVKVEELGKAIRAYERKNPTVDKKTLNTTFKKLGKLSESSEQKRDEKRKEFPKIVEKVAELQKNPALTKKYDVDTLVKSASKEVSNSNGSSGDKLPQNSSEKYKIVDGLLKDKYEFAVLLFAEGLYRDDNGVQVDSETKRVIDSVDEIIVVGNEIAKISEIEDYAKSLNKKVTTHIEDVLEVCDKLKVDNRKGFVYVNGASLFSQRPEFMNYLKAKYPNSRIAMIVLDLLFGKSQVYKGATLKERITVYGGVENFDEVVTKFKLLVKFSKFRKYADLPQEKYIVFV
jgi:hypothetical protein